MSVGSRGSPREILSPVPVWHEKLGQENRARSAPGISATQALFDKLVKLAERPKTDRETQMDAVVYDRKIPVMREAALTMHYAEKFLGVAKDAAKEGKKRSLARREPLQMPEKFVLFAKAVAEEAQRLQSEALLKRIREKTESIRKSIPNFDEVQNAVISNDKAYFEKLQAQKKSEFDKETTDFLKQVVSIDPMIVGAVYAYLQGNETRVNLLLENVGDKKSVIDAIEKRNLNYFESRRSGSGVL
jgi:hypothetical protein